MKHLLLAVLVTLALAGGAVGDSPQETVIYAFQGGSDGSFPYAGLVAGPGGVLYGTTTAGGGDSCGVGCGTIFRLTPPSTAGEPWVETVLYRFTEGSDGDTPWAGLTSDGAGNLYGATILGGGTCGCGVIFELSPPAIAGGAWTYSVLYRFKGVREGDGNGPEGTLVFDNSGNLYGATYSGGIPCSDSGPYGCGTVFRLSPPTTPGGTWTETVLYRFDPNFEGAPSAGVILDGKGDLYGTAVNDGVAGGGTAYKLTPNSTPPWEKTVLHVFGGSLTDGIYPWAGLTFGADGALYGATAGYAEQVGDGGTAFRLTPPASSGENWTETILYVFPGDNGAAKGPYGSLLASPTGALYGMTASGGTGSCQVYGWLGCGTVFQMTPPAAAGETWTHTTLHNFTGGTDGEVPYGSLIFGPGNALYGTTFSGGSGDCSQYDTTGCGTIFRVAP